VRLRELDPADTEDLRRFWEVEQAAQRADREWPVLRGWDALLLSAQQPSSHARHVWLAAEEDGDLVGAADLMLTTKDNLHLAELEVNVAPGHRRRGIGRLLHDRATEIARADGRSTFLAEVSCPMDADGAGYAFAGALGYSSVHLEHHLVLALPADPPARDVPGWEVLAWSGPTPEELREGYVAMRTQMALDVPMGEVDYEPQEFTLADLDEQETRMATAYDWVTAVARTADGTLGGYSVVFVPRGDRFGWQDDTLVMPEHRGHGLGGALKHATLGVLRREHPALETLQTWTDPDNHAMYATNLGFGYRPVERMHEMQRMDRNGREDR